jgi:cell division transport system permease protein
MLQRSDISFDKDDTSRFLPWLIAFMVFLAALSISGLFVLSDITQNLGSGFSNKITVQIPVSRSLKTDDLRKTETLRLLRALTGVKRADPLSTEEVQELLKPWLGDAATLEQLPIPSVINVEIDRTKNISVKMLRAVLLPKIPDILVDDHREWLNYLANSIRSIEIIAFSIVLLVTLTTVGTVIFTTRTSMGLQRETINVLHVIGAHDYYIANQFAVRAAWLGVKGGTLGIIVSVPLLFGFRFVIASLGTDLMPEISLHAAGWVSVVLIVPTIAIIAMVTAYMTVLKSLASLP